MRPDTRPDSTGLLLFVAAIYAVMLAVYLTVF